MVDSAKLDELARKLTDALPGGFKELRDDAQRNLRAALSALLAKMELVTREDFDIQSAVLARTREKVEQLEKRVAELETRSR
jgi:BMFP domain-containing protein YqiC